MIDYLIVAALTYGLSWVLNKKYFNESPISRTKAIVFSLAMFVILTVILTGLMYMRYSGLGIQPTKPLDFSSISLAIFFYIFLNKVKKGEYEILTPDGGSVATFDSKEKADEYISKNIEKNYVIKEK
jgi:hypothetical protein